MSLKQRIAVYVSTFFSLLLGIISIIVYIQLASFRAEEAKDRLEEKALNTMRLLIDVKEVDQQILKLIDINTINRLYNEKTLIFNDKFELIYSSVDDAVINWTHKDLQDLKKDKQFFRVVGQYDYFGVYYDSQSQDYYALMLAEDRYGNRKVQYLGYILLAMFIISTSVVWLVSWFLGRSLVAPLDTFQRTITNISENNLTMRLTETPKKDEINLMAKAFNQMMLRLEDSYNRQKEFTSNASHELRTPIARIMAQLENLIRMPGHSPETFTYLRNIAADAEQTCDLVNSLLLLSRIEDKEGRDKPDIKRIDEVIFDAVVAVKVSFPKLVANFSIVDNMISDQEMEIECNEPLLKIAFTNLLNNAYLYSDDQKVIIELGLAGANAMRLTFSNNGKTLTDKEQENLFQAFMRGKNAQSKPGTGLGLRITQRILFYHGASITYSDRDNRNNFEIIFSF